MKLSINILTWNCFKTLLQTLCRLEYEFNEVNVEREIIIVDNGSIDGCEKIAKIRNETNLGISVGKNQGIKASQGEYILLLDGDIVIVPNSIICLLEYMSGHKEIDALGFFPTQFTNQKDRDNKIYAEQRCNRLWEPQEYPATCLYYGLFRRTVFDKCMLDESFGPGYGWEDHDFFEQMKAAGIKQWVAGINTKNGKYYHEINSSIRQMGREEYVRTSKERGEKFKAKWGCQTK